MNPDRVRGNLERVRERIAAAGGDPAHRLGVAEAYAERLPRGELLVEQEGRSPIAWQGARLSKAIARFLHS